LGQHTGDEPGPDIAILPVGRLAISETFTEFTSS